MTRDAGADGEPIRRMSYSLAQAQKRLKEAGVGSSRLDGELLMAQVVGRDRAWVLAHDDTDLDDLQLERFEQLMRRRAAREPLVHLTGTREFYGLELAVTPDVLTPRVETEQMVAWAVEYAPRDSRLIDVGTGSGALAVAIAAHRPDLTVTATDVSERELAVARRNAQWHGARVALVVSDLWEHVDGEFETIVTNLPYLRDDAREELTAEVRHEPAVALFGGSDGLELYRRFLRNVPEHLVRGGFLFTECDPWQHEDLIAEAAKVGLRPVEQGYFILGFRRD